MIKKIESTAVFVLLILVFTSHAEAFGTTKVYVLSIVNLKLEQDEKIISYKMVMPDPISVHFLPKVPEGWVLDFNLSLAPPFLYELTAESGNYDKALNIDYFNNFMTIIMECRGEPEVRIEMKTKDAAGTIRTYQLTEKNTIFEIFRKCRKENYHYVTINSKRHGQIDNYLKLTPKSGTGKLYVISLKKSFRQNKLLVMANHEVNIKNGVIHAVLGFPESWDYRIETLKPWESHISGGLPMGVGHRAIQELEDFLVIEEKPNSKLEISMSIDTEDRAKIQEYIKKDIESEDYKKEYKLTTKDFDIWRYE